MTPRIFAFLIIVMLLICTAFFGQTPPYLWDHRFGDSDYQFAGQLATDVYGNLVLTGSFSGTVDFGGGPLSAGYFKDIFLAKFDHNGNHIWSHQFGDTTDDQQGRCVTIDGAGNVLLAGEFNNTVDLGGGSFVSQGDPDMFLAKLTPDGDHIWSKAFGDLDIWVFERVQVPTGIAVDELGNVFFAGGFENTVDFGGGPLASMGGSDVFFVKYDANGTHMWSKRFGDASAQSASGLIVDPSGEVLLVGNFQGTVDFGGGPLVSMGACDIFVTKFSPYGVLLWSERFGVSENQFAESVATDASSNVLMTGSFEDTLDFGGGPLVSQGGYDIFLAKLDASGSHIWSQSFGDEAIWRQSAYDVAADPDGNVLLTGEFEGTVDFGGGPLVNVGASDIFCAKFDPAGTHVWSASYGDISPVNYHVSRSVCPDPWGNAVFTGYFNGALTFGPVSLISHGHWDIFLAKLIPTDDPTSVHDIPTPLELSVTACPNPFNPNTTIRYEIPSAGVASLVIYDVRGKRIRALVNEPKTPGIYTAVWNGLDTNGRRVASGVYFYQLEVGGVSQTKKMLLLR